MNTKKIECLKSGEDFIINGVAVRESTVECVIAAALMHAPGDADSLSPSPEGDQTDFYVQTVPNPKPGVAYRRIITRHPGNDTDGDQWTAIETYDENCSSAATAIAMCLYPNLKNKYRIEDGKAFLNPNYSPA